MIISHKFRYLFIEIPVTGSYAIHHELRKNYDGVEILHKHASYAEFRHIATADEKKYFVFASERHPLDKAVSGFFKLKTDHKSAFSNSEASIEKGLIDYAEIKAYEYIKDSNATFESAFLKPKLWNRPYSSMIELSNDNLDFVIRYENLQEDFAEVLRLLGIEQVRPLPVVNKTRARNTDWESYYTPRMIKKAKQVYGPFMKKWGYDFPEDWGDYQTPWIKKLEFRLVNKMKAVYLIHLRYSDKPYAKIIRQVRARMANVF